MIQKCDSGENVNVSRSSQSIISFSLDEREDDTRFLGMELYYIIDATRYSV